MSMGRGMNMNMAMGNNVGRGMSMSNNAGRGLNMGRGRGMNSQGMSMGMAGFQQGRGRGSTGTSMGMNRNMGMSMGMNRGNVGMQGSMAQMQNGQQQMMGMQMRLAQNNQSSNSNATTGANSGQGSSLNLQGRLQGSSAILADESSNHELSCIFRTVPRGGDCSFMRCLLDTLRHALRMLGLDNPDTKHISLMIRWTLVKMVMADLQVLRNGDLPMYDAELLLLSCRQLAHAAGKQSAMKGSTTTTDQLFDIKRTITALEKRVDELTKDRLSLDVPPEIKLYSNSVQNESAKLALFGRLHDMQDIESLAGGAAVPPIYRPVQLSLVPNSVSSFHDVGVCLRHADNICTRLSYQRDLVKNTFCLRAALIQDIFTSVIPLPLPLDHPKRKTQCFWASQEMRYETQADILRLLDNIAQHFCAAALSLRLTRSFDAVRILTMASIATIADAVMRIRASDVPSQLAMHYAGTADGPVRSFGIEMRMFAAESTSFLLTDPKLVLVRTQVLDYFTQMNKDVDDEHLLFRWERSMAMGQAEYQLLDQLCLEIGYPRGKDIIGQYLVGTRREVLRDFPEFAAFRDIIFRLKALMVPTSDALPDIRPWSPMEAVLSWTFSPGGSQQEDLGTFKVSGFNREMKCEWPNETLDGDGGQTNTAWYAKVFSKIKSLFFHVSPRAPPSMADPSFLVGKKIECEDDVLHIRQLPDFGGRINARNCELLLQYLTAPYLRIPLLLRFFSSAEQTAALANQQLQDMLDAVLFEPGEWHPEKQKTCPEK